MADRLRRSSWDLLGFLSRGPQHIQHSQALPRDAAPIFLACGWSSKASSRLLSWS